MASKKKENKDSLSDPNYLNNLAFKTYIRVKRGGTSKMIKRTKGIFLQDRKFLIILPDLALLCLLMVKKLF